MHALWTPPLRRKGCFRRYLKQPFRRNGGVRGNCSRDCLVFPPLKKGHPHAGLLSVFARKPARIVAASQANAFTLATPPQAIWGVQRASGPLAAGGIPPSGFDARILLLLCFVEVIAEGARKHRLGGIVGLCFGWRGHGPGSPGREPAGPACGTIGPSSSGPPRAPGPGPGAEPGAPGGRSHPAGAPSGLRWGSRPGPERALRWGPRLWMAARRGGGP